MKRISAEKYVEGVNSIYVEKPAYETGHDGDDGKCDCIGMCRGGLERGGATGITNMRGTNQAARHAIQNLQEIVGTAQLMIGDVVLKVRDKDDKTMPLPDKYRKGGSDYSAKWGETNFTHIGTVTKVYPLEITHMTSPTAKKDTKIGNWKYFGELPWVEYEAAPEPPPEPEPEDGIRTATVTAPSGETVKMRAKPSTKCNLYWDVPIGSRVIVDRDEGEWSRITWNDMEGYMMSRFLEAGSEGSEWTVTIRGLTREQAEELCKEWKNSEMST